MKGKSSTLIIPSNSLNGGNTIFRSSRLVSYQMLYNTFTMCCSARKSWVSSFKNILAIQIFKFGCLLWQRKRKGYMETFQQGWWENIKQSHSTCLRYLSQEELSKTSFLEGNFQSWEIILQRVDNLHWPLEIRI